MGRGMRWSPINKSRGKYFSLPSPAAESPPPSPGAIELPTINGGDDEEYEVYAVHASHRSKIRTVAAISVAVSFILPLIVTGVVHSAKSKNESNANGGVDFPSHVLLGNGFGGNINDSLLVKSEDFSPPYDTRKDFRNELGKVPPYWEKIELVVNSPNVFSSITSWGPCYRPSSKEISIDWLEQVHHETPYRFSNDQIVYPQASKVGDGSVPQSHFYAGDDDLVKNQNLSGLCRPGFLIIGQAKCGTSSLYHYLTGHPRVLPASQKQLDYFKYLSFKPMEWYLSNFPSIQTFLARGAIMTGESSPSYFPYPEVPHLIHERTRMGSQINTASRVSHPKIIAIVRDPISRAMSSYKYNYVDPAMKMLLKRPNDPKVKAAMSNIAEGMTESYYRENHLFSFEDLVRAEISVLQQCLKPGGVAEQMSRRKYGPPNGIYADAYIDSALPLVNADEFCYGESVSDSVPLSQWAYLIRQNPDKVIIGLDYHLISSIVGRSLYSLFLNWWYAKFSDDDIHVVCTEELHFHPAKAMLNVSLFLGLPEFDFSNVTAEGMYNVGFHQGYDTITSWDDIQNEAEAENDTDDRDFANIGYDVNLSDELRDELVDFFQPYNEALFRLTGKTCQWY
ncbi:hypothetical protein HJC23_001170 [Cyclotella cryptica]|uniref:Sulfotransferase domain-containing protein n=1 Tax=Cyclotella cryptica TaxID=29204 RepID=A0ABD3QMV8_9STRA|eukprot:CCRYP_003804-RB/>CCRYP_003804-RB protein AED:0.03 eAED:0.03 QI:158/-1/1/1/-1/1/1/326/620